MEISSNEPIEYVEKSGELIAKGDARITVNDFVIQADEIKFQREKNTAIASGNVKIDNGKIYALADTVSYDASSDMIHGERCKVRVHDYYFTLKNIDIGPDIQAGEEATIFCCDPRRAVAPSMEVKKFQILNGQALDVKNSTLKIGAVPVFFLPTARIKMRERPFYVEQNIGMSRRCGASLQNDFYVGTTDCLRIGGILDVSTKRGVLIGPALKIDSGPGENRIFSEVKLGFISDRASENVRGKDIAGRQIEKHRYFFKLACKQHFADKIDVISDVTVLSDSGFERDFRKSWYEKNQRPTSFGEVAYRGTNYIASVLAAFEPNNFYDATQRLPELRIDYLPTAIFDSKIVHRAHLAFARLRGTDMADPVGSKVTGYRTDAYYGLSLPMHPANFATVKPIFGARCLMYGHNSKESDHGKCMVQGGFDIDFKFVGRSNYSNCNMEIDGIRHTLNPVVQYRVIPSGNMENGIRRFDVDYFDVEIPSINLDEIRNVDSLKRQNVLRFGVRNSWYTRSGAYVPRKLARFDILQDVLFARNYDDRTLSRQKRFQDTHLMIGVSPIPPISFDAYGRIDPSKMRFRELKTVFTLRDGDFWRATLFSRYLVALEDKVKQFGMSFAFNVSSRTSLSFEIRYDAVAKKLTEHRIGLSTTLWNSLVADFGIMVRKNTRREDKIQFDWHIGLLDF
jgi:LPS-assembly protein